MFDNTEKRVEMANLPAPRVRRQLAALVMIVLAPLLMQQSPNEPIEQLGYKELNPRWEHAGVITGSPTGDLVGAVPCPGEDTTDNCLVSVDSAGTAVEFRFADGAWHQERTFSIGHPVTAVCAGAPQHDRRWRVYVGSSNGQVTELTRNDLGWTTKPVITLDQPIAAIYASHPGAMSVSQMFVIDGGGHATNLWIGNNQDWVRRPIPDIKGGITDLITSPDRSGLRILVAGPSGELHKFVQDTMGYWSGGLWTTMPDGVLDMAASADPTMKDIAVYFSGRDGHFRYLFYDHKTDDVARVPVAAGVSHLIGKQDEFRYNEFMGLLNGEYCQFEFSFTDRQWNRIPMHRVGNDVVSATFGKARPGRRNQFYVTTARGEIHEFVRQKMMDEAADGE
ncbi:MAG: hypothetical protein Kow0074_04240 [Candidatus Zixiibacteriota bacterium]